MTSYIYKDFYHGGDTMKYKLEIQYNGFDIDTEEIVKMVKESLKKHKIPVTKIEELSIYYTVNTKVIYYTGVYNNKKVSSEIYLV